MGPISRRSFLAAGLGSGTVALTGCLGTRDAELGAGGDDRMTVRGVAVDDLPGGPIPVMPENTAVLLDFWATWCAPCKPQMAELRTIRERFPALHMLSITNEDDPEGIRSFWRTYGGTWPVGMDPSLATNDRFGVTRIPTLLLFTRDHERVWTHSGLATAGSIAERLETVG